MFFSRKFLFCVGLIYFPVLEGFAYYQSPQSILRHAQKQDRLPIRKYITSGNTKGSQGDKLLLMTLVSDVEPLENNKPSLFEPLGVGLRRDFARRLPLYISDIQDGLNAQTLASTLFLFFACLAPAIGFGSVLQIATLGQMGVLEMCASTALCGTIYGLAAAQPLQIGM